METPIHPSHPSDIGAEFIRLCRQRLMKEYAPRVQACVATLTEDDIWWRSHETDNSVGNLLLHLSGNIRQWIVVGIGGGSDARNRPLEFSERGPIPKADLMQKFERAVGDADRVLSVFDLSKMLEVRHFQKYDVTCLEAISHVVEHVAQHLGQIIYITKLRTGKDMKFFNL